MVKDIIIFFICSFFLTILIIVSMHKIISSNLFRIVLYFIFIFCYFIALFLMQRNLVESYIEGTGSIGKIIAVKPINRIDFQYNVKIKLKNKYKNKYNAKEAKYDFSQNELKRLRLIKKIKKSSRIIQLTENKNSYKKFKKNIKSLRTDLNLFDALMIVCIAIFLVFALPREWDPIIILIIRFLSIVITFVYFINSDLKNFFVIYELVLFYTISEFLFENKKWVGDKLQSNNKFSQESKESIREKLFLLELKKQNNIK